MNSFLGDTSKYREAMEMDSDISDQSSQHSGVSLQHPENSTTSENIMSPPSTIPEDRPQSRSSSQSSVTSRRRKRAPQEEPIYDELNRLENIRSAINTNTEYDEFHYFGLNLADQLRSLPLYDALDVQTQIQNILITARRRHLCLNLPPVTESTLINTQSTLNNTPQTGTQFCAFPNVTESTLINTQSTLNNTPQTGTQFCTLPNVTESTLINTQSTLNNTPQTVTQFCTLPNIDLLHQAWQSS